MHDPGRSAWSTSTERGGHGCWGSLFQEGRNSSIVVGKNGSKQRLRGPSRGGMCPELQDPRGPLLGAEPWPSPAGVLSGPHLRSHLHFFQSRGQAQAPQQTQSWIPAVLDMTFGLFPHLTQAVRAFLSDTECEPHLLLGARTW